MICKYSCSRCGIVRAEVEVPPRARAVDLKFWIEGIVALYIGNHHRSLSPTCPARTMSDLMIPYKDTDEFVGQEKKEGNEK